MVLDIVDCSEHIQSGKEKNTVSHIANMFLPEIQRLDPEQECTVNVQAEGDVLSVCCLRLFLRSEDTCH